MHARSPDGRDPPAIQFNYLTDPTDQAAQIAGVRIARKIAAQPELAGLVEHETNLARGRKPTGRSSISSGTPATPSIIRWRPCTWGGDERAPLDARLRVRGVERLRVADASVMPRLVSGNTNAPTIMIGEKASDMIIEDARAHASP